MKKIILIALCAILSAGLIGCTLEADQLIGEWRVSDRLEQQALMSDIEPPDPFFILEENNKLMMPFGEEDALEGTYTIQGNRVTITFPDELFSEDMDTNTSELDFVKRDDGSYALQYQGEDVYVKK